MEDIEEYRQYQSSIIGIGNIVRYDDTQSGLMKLHKYYPEFKYWTGEQVYGGKCGCHESAIRKATKEDLEIWKTIRGI